MVDVTRLGPRDRSAVEAAHLRRESAWYVDPDLGEGAVREDPDGTRHLFRPGFGDADAEGASFPPRWDHRRVVSVGELTDEEMALIMAAEVPEGHRYELEDLDDEGRFLPGRFPGWRAAGNGGLPTGGASSGVEPGEPAMSEDGIVLDLSVRDADGVVVDGTTVEATRAQVSAVVDRAMDLVLAHRDGGDDARALADLDDAMAENGLMEPREAPTPAS